MLMAAPAILSLFATRAAIVPAAPADVAALASSAGVDLYGDALPRGAVARLGTVRYRHPGWYKRIEFLPDHESFITGTTDNSIYLWKARTGERLFQFDFEGNALRAFCMGSDGKTVAATSHQRTMENMTLHMRLSLFRAPLWRERGRFDWDEPLDGDEPKSLALRRTAFTLWEAWTPDRFASGM